MKINNFFENIIFDSMNSEETMKKIQRLDLLIKKDAKKFQKKEYNFSHIEKSLFKCLENMPDQEELSRIYYFHKMIAGIAILIIYIYLFI